MPDDIVPNARSISRRLFLAACVPAVACARKDPGPAAPRPVSVPLSRLPEGARLKVVLGEHPVEVVRTSTGLAARSLLCTHQGCEVAWDAASASYKCPCHEGRYDAEGRPVEGPPPKPLATVAVRVEGENVLVGP